MEHKNNLQGQIEKSIFNFVFFIIVLACLSAFTPTVFAAPAVNLDQCANGAVGTPKTQCIGANGKADPVTGLKGWENGNLNNAKSQYFEGNFVPYRARLTDLTEGNIYEIKIEWDATKGEQHAIDYIASVDQREINPVPCDANTTPGADCTITDSLPIPPDSFVITGGPTPPIDQQMGQFDLYGGTFMGVANNISGYTYTPNTLFNDTTSTDIVVRFRYTGVTGGTAVLAWSGHISKRSDWSEPLSAIFVNGSPYHMRVIDFNCYSSADVLFTGKQACSVGNQDRSLKVNPGGSFTIIKDVVDVDGTDITDVQDFTFLLTKTDGTTPKNTENKPILPLILDDDGDETNTYLSKDTFKGILGSTLVRPRTYVISETAVAGWILDSIECTESDGSSIGAVDLNSSDLIEGKVTITLPLGEDVTCRFTNKPDFVAAPKIMLLKGVAEPSINPEVVGGPGDTQVDAGDTVSYIFDVTNTGNVPLSDVAIMDELITTLNAPYEMITCASTFLAVDADGMEPYDDAAMTRCTAIYVIKPTDLDKGEINNNANACANTPDGTTPSEVCDDDPHDEPLPQAPLIKADKDLKGNADGDGSGDVSVGDVLTYTIKATNIGTITLNTVTVDDDLTNTNDAPCAAILAPGDSCEVDVMYTVQLSDVNTTIMNTGTVTGQCIDNNDPTQCPATDTDPEDVPVPLPSLIVDKPAPTNADEDGSGDVSVGDTLTYTVTATNNSTLANLTNVVVTDNLITPKGGTTPCALVAPGGTCTLIGTYVVTASDLTAGQIDNLGAADSDQVGPVTDPETVQVPSSILSIIKTNNGPAPEGTGGWTDSDNSGDVSVDDTITYSYEVTNTGIANFTNITLSDNQLPGVSVSNLTTGLTDIDNDGESDDIAAGATATGTATYVIQASDIGTTINNVATADSDQTDPPVTDDSDVVVPKRIDLSLTKTVDNSTPTVGTDVVFTITVANAGPSDATGVTVSDLLPNGYTYVSHIASGDYDEDSGIWTIGALAKDTSISLMITATVNAAGNYTNYAQVQTAIETDIDSIPGNGPQIPDEDDDDSVTVIPDILPDISVMKTADPTSVPETTGGDVMFTYVVTNNSLEDATITMLGDDKFGVLAGDADCAVDTVLAGNGSCTFTATFNVPAGDVGTSHVNVFTAKAVDNEGNEDTATDDATVTYTDVLPDISVMKTADPLTVPETTGGDVMFTYVVTNNSLEAATITMLGDDKFGVLVGDADCAVNTVLAGNGSCTFKATFNVPAGDADGTHVNEFTAKAVDNEGNEDTATDDATVTYTDVLPDISVMKTADPLTVPETTGGDVMFTYVVTNNSLEAATITMLGDDKFGVLVGDADCAVNTVLAGNGSCTFKATFNVPAGDADGTHVNEFTAKAVDNEGNEDTATDDATVTYTDVLPDISVMKTADPLTVPETTGGDVMFTYVVTNNSLEAATITMLGDDKFGVLVGDADCAVNTVLAGSGSCTFKATFNVPAGDADGTHVNEFTAKAVDNEGNEDTATDDATVTYTDVLPDISVMKTADPLTVPETTGGDVMFTYVVTNNSLEAATITMLGDDKFGVLVGDADCAVNTVLAGSGSCTFKATFNVPAGDADGTHVNEFTAKAVDNEGNEDTATDDATVTYTDVLPDISVMKTADPLTVPETTGGDVMFTYVVTNNSLEAATITMLGDDKFGVLVGDADCAVNTVLAGSGSCTFKATFNVPAGDADGTHVNEFTAKAVDNEGNEDTATDDATVTYTDVLPDISVMKTADPLTVPETTGGDVMFTYVVTNNSLEAATITMLGDDKFGVLVGDADCAVNTVLAGSGSCTFKATFNVPAGDADGTHVNEFTAKAVDNEGNEDTATDDATVTYTDVLPDISVMKTADPLTVPETTGGDVMFTYVVTNNSLEAATITMLGDDKFGVLVGDADCAVNTVLAGNGSCTFKATFNVPAGDADGTHVNEFTAKAVDNEGNEDTATDDATVTYTDVLPDISVMKTADPLTVPETTGGDVMFTYVVTNNSLEAATITMLGDDKFGVLVGDADCAVNTVLAGNGSCTFKATFNVPAGDADGTHVNEFTAKAVDNEGNEDTATDDATVTYTDVLPDISVMKTADPLTVPETTGGDVMFTYVVTNNSLEAATITMLGDDKFGVLVGDADCAVNTVLAGSGSCTFKATFNVPAGDADGTHVNEFTAKAVDNEGNEDTATDDATVTYTDVLPDISVMKTADPLTVPETTGGDVMFTYVVTNNSLEAATITMLGDDKFGVLVGDADCAVNTVLAGSGSCTFKATFNVPAGDADGTHVNEFTAKAVDNEGNEDTATDDATVTYTDVLPDISVMKTADPLTVPETTGGDVMFTYVVTNNSLEAATITMLGDDKFGVLVGDADCAVNTVLAGNGSCTFKATFNVPAGDADGTHVNEFTAKAVDNEGNEDTATDDATVTYTDVPPTVVVDKTTTTPIIVQPGGVATYIVTIENTSLETVTITALSDNTFTDITTVGGDITATNCATGVGLGVSDINPGTGADFYTCMFSANVTGNGGDTHVNTVTGTVIDNDSSSASDTGMATVSFINPSIDIEKSSDADATTSTGDTITYTYDVHNNGDVALTNLRVTDVHEGSGPSFSAITCAPIAQSETLLVNATTECSATYVVVLEDIDRGFIDNTARAVGTPSLGPDVSDVDPLKVQLTQSPDIETLKVLLSNADEDGSNSVTPGDTLTYKITATNKGNVTLNNVDVDDSLTGQMDIPCPAPATLAPTESCFVTVNYVVVAGDTVIENTGTACGDDPLSVEVCDDEDEEVPVCGLSIDKQCAVVPNPLPFVCSDAKPLNVIGMTWNGTQTVSVKAWKGSVGSTLLADIPTVNPQDEVTVTGYAGAPNDVFWEVFVGGSKVGESKFHLSCSDDNMNGPEDCGQALGDGKGDDPGFINTWGLELLSGNGQTLDCSPVPEPPSDNCEVVGAPNPSCASLGKPTNLVFEYIGNACDAAANNQGSKTSCTQSGTLTGDASISSDSSDLNLSTGNLSIGDELTVSGKFGSTSLFSLVTDTGTQALNIHTSCSAPLEVGDEFGGLRLVEMNGQRGGVEVNYIYTLTNNGAALTGIDVVDNLLGTIGSSIDMAEGESDIVVLNTVAMLTGTTTNTVDASGVISLQDASGGISSGETCIATDSSTVTVIEPCNVCKGGTTDLTFKYNGINAAMISIYDNSSASIDKILFTGMVQPGGDIPISKRVGEDKLNNTISIYVNGNLHDTLHVSCSEPIGAGMIVGDFEIIEGRSRDNGLMCPLNLCDTDAAALEFSGREVRWDLTNNGDVDIEIERIFIQWNNSNGNLTEIKRDGDTIHKGNFIPISAVIESGWEGDANKRTIKSGDTDTIKFKFDNDVATEDYEIIIEFTQGCAVEISVLGPP